MIISHKIRAHFSKLIFKCLLIATALALMLMAYLMPNHWGNNNSQFSLITAQAILKNQSIQIDAYQPILHVISPDGQDKKITIDLHTQQNIITTLLLLPTVKVSHYLGWDMTIKTDNQKLQYILAAVSYGIIFLLLYALARLYLNPLRSYNLAILFLWGTAYTASLVNAVNSYHFMAIISLSLTLILLRSYKKNHSHIAIIPMAVLLGLLFLLSAMNAWLVSLIIIILLIYWPHQAIKIALALFLTGLIAFLISHYQGQWYLELPQHYQSAPTLLSIQYNLFLYSPFLLVSLLSIKLWWHIARDRMLYFLIILWASSFLLNVSWEKLPVQNDIYGAYWSIMLLPALFLALVFYFNLFIKQHWPYIILFVLSAIISILMNGQALVNPYLKQWFAMNEVHHLSSAYEYPPFLYNKRRHNQRQLDLARQSLDQGQTKTWSLCQNNDIIDQNKCTLHLQTGTDSIGFIDQNKIKMALSSGRYILSITYHSNMPEIMNIAMGEILLYDKQDVVPWVHYNLLGTLGKNKTQTIIFNIPTQWHKKLAQFRFFYNGRGKISFKAIQLKKINPTNNPEIK